MAILVICCIVLLAVTPSFAQFDCRFATGTLRSCTCGLQYRIIEERCCSPKLCLQPNIRTDNLTDPDRCPFQCMNGGVFNSLTRQCSCQNGFHGLCCERETRVCGDVLLTAEGGFTSPDFPMEYPNNIRCVWRISTDLNRRIALGTVEEEFVLETGSNYYSCNYDFLSVLDGPDRNSKEIKSFCGGPNFPRTFHTVYSTGPNMYIEFKSDSVERRKGFRMQYKSFFAGQECGPFTQFTRPFGNITSPQYPLQYRPKEKCKWTIILQPGFTDVILTVTAIDVPSTRLCRWGDRLLVSGKRNNEIVPLTVFCGRTPFQPYRVKNVSEVILKFTSDSTQQGKGFKLTYQQQ